MERTDAPVVAAVGGVASWASGPANTGGPEQAFERLERAEGGVQRDQRGVRALRAGVALIGIMWVIFVKGFMEFSV